MDYYNKNGSKPVFDARNERNSLLIKMAEQCLAGNNNDDYITWLRGLQNIHLLCQGYIKDEIREDILKSLNICDKRVSLWASKSIPAGYLRKALLDANSKIFIAYKDQFLMSTTDEDYNPDDLI